MALKYVNTRFELGCYEGQFSDGMIAENVEEAQLYPVEDRVENSNPRGENAADATA